MQRLIHVRTDGGGRWHSVGGDNRRHRCSSHWCHRTEDRLLRAATGRVITSPPTDHEATTNTRSNLRHGVRSLGLLSADGRVRRQRDACGGVTGRLRPLNTDGGRRRVNGQSRTPGRPTGGTVDVHSDVQRDTRWTLHQPLLLPMSHLCRVRHCRTDNWGLSPRR